MLRFVRRFLWFKILFVSTVKYLSLRHEKPNILIIILDQLNGSLLDYGPKLFSHAPPVLMEHSAEEVIAPLVGMRDGDFKFIYCPVDPLQFFDLA